ncbi:MAG: oligoribonuclease [Actinomycetes bacterium]|jgi:oligoribonuclease
MTDYLVWIDCEMTGLDLDKDALIELAVLVTNAELEILGEGVDIVIKPPQSAVDQMDEVVRTMHQSSGLLAELDRGMSLAEAEQRALEYIKAYVPTVRRAPLAGNSVATDRGFLARDMPTLEGHLHYRMVDVSSIKELVRRWYPRVYFNSPEKTGNHRALGDIKDSITELRFYRRAIFIPQPGPDTDEVRAISAEMSPAPLPDLPATTSEAPATSDGPPAILPD